MQVLVAILIVVALWTADAFRESTVSHPAASFLMVLVCCSIVILGAVILTREARRHQSSGKDSVAHHRFRNRLHQVHTTVWIGSCLLTSLVAKWGVLVRQNWGLDHYFLVDEFLIAAPILLPLFLSWLIFGFDAAEENGTATTRNKLSSAFEFAGLRAQVYLALTLVPMLVLWVANDTAYLFGAAETEWVQWSVLFFAFLVATICFPWLLTLVWPNQKVPAGELRHRLESVAQEKKIRISDIRIWKTGNQITNAMVAGFFWPFRIIWLSDRIVDLLSKDELDAVMRHEIGHARRLHLPTRLAFLVLPILFATGLYFAFPAALENWGSRLESVGISQSWCLWVLIPSLGIIYLVWTLSWLSHAIEKDADIEACLNENVGLPIPSDSMLHLDARRVNHYKSALMKIADQLPGGIHRQTLLHPSILDRAMFLTRLCEQPQQLRQFRNQYAWKIVGIPVTLAAISMLIVLV